MKFILPLCLVILSSCATQSDSVIKQNTIIEQTKLNSHWFGKYDYEEEHSFYSLEIDKNTCLYEGVGIQLFFKVSCTTKLTENRIEIYFKELIEGSFLPMRWMNKDKPILTLYYNDGVLQTEETLYDKTSGKLLFKKAE